MKKVVTIIFILLILTLVFTSITKFIKNLVLNVDEKNQQNIQSLNSIVPNKTLPKWVKNDYFIPNGFWINQSSNQNLIIGNKYFLIQTLFMKEKCFMGVFFLKKIINNDLYFSSAKKYPYSRLKQYSQLKSYKIETIILSENNLPIFDKIQNCSEWVKIENF